MRSLGERYVQYLHAGFYHPQLSHEPLLLLDPPLTTLDDLVLLERVGRLQQDLFVWSDEVLFLLKPADKLE